MSFSFEDNSSSWVLMAICIFSISSWALLASASASLSLLFKASVSGPDCPCHTRKAVKLYALGKKICSVSILKYFLVNYAVVMADVTLTFYSQLSIAISSFEHKLWIIPFDQQTVPGDGLRSSVHFKIFIFGFGKKYNGLS